MKKLILCASFLLLSIVPMQLKAETKVDPMSTTSNSKAPMSAEVRILMNRLEEIKKMEISTLTSSEKKELRNEVREIKSEMRAVGGGVYISVGAIILILILLIVLL
jgi:hypothetical protein